MAKRSADFSDEDEVLVEMASELKLDPDDCSIEEDGGLTSFGEGVVYRLSCGRREWIIAESTDAAEELAKAVVRQDLESEPEIFNKSFLESHIDTERLRRELHSDVQSSNYDRLEEMDAEEFWREAEGFGMDVPEQEEDEDGELEELRDPTSSEVDDLAEKMTDEELRDPMAYLSDIYGDEEAVEQAIKIAGIDIDAATDQAIRDDGWEHFLSRYDGNSDETASGFVYWREN